MELATPDGVMSAYEATPTGDPRGAVVVAVEAFGVTAHIRDVTQRFAAVGYHAIAPDYQHRSGQGPLDDYTAGLDAILPRFEGVDDDTVLADTDATLDHLRDAGFGNERTGMVGFCFGGRVSFLVATRRSLGAAVGFYGGGITEAGRLGLPALIGEAATLKTPWLGLFGDDDPGIPVEGVEELRAALALAPVATEVIRYPGAGHAFHRDVGATYHEPSAKDGWARALAWLDAHMA